MLKVLMVSEVYTHEHNAGNRQRVYRECAEMKKLGWEVDFLYWGSRLTPNMDEMIEFFGREHFYFVNTTGIALKYQIKSFIRNRMNKANISKIISLKYAADELYYEEVGEKVKRLCDKNHYEVVWMQYYTQSRAFEYMEKNVYKIIDTHDKFANRNRIFQRKFKTPEYIYTTTRGERKALSRADMVIAIQNKEREYFSKLLKNKNTSVELLGDMVTLNKPEICSRKNYGFIGATNGANVLGIQWFINNVLPIVKKLEPKSNFIIAGGICNLLPDSIEYRKLGFVKDVKEFYTDIRFAINPVQNGTGLNIKSIEALSYTKPLITTSIGAKGLGNNNRALEIKDDPNLFAQAIVELLNNDNKCNTMQLQAEQYIVDSFKENINQLIKIESIVNERVKLYG